MSLEAVLKSPLEAVVKSPLEPVVKSPAEPCAASSTETHKDQPVLAFATPAAFAAWLAVHHASHPGF